MKPRLGLVGPSMDSFDSLTDLVLFRLQQSGGKVIRSSTPIRPSIDPVSANIKKNTSATSSTNSMSFEKIYPGIYLTSAKNLCSSECLKIFGFTHIIYIDKHIIERGKCTDDDARASDTNRMQYFASESHQHDDCAPSTSKSDQIVHRITAQITLRPVDGASSAPSSADPIKNENLFGHSDFETLDLNFGESSYLTTVLPNCYKAVKFIENALKNNGAVLVIDCIGENQKCITIVIGFLMYKYNKNFL